MIAVVDEHEHAPMSDADLAELARARAAVVAPEDRCPHSSKPGQVRAGCSRCLGVEVERVLLRAAAVPEDDEDDEDLDDDEPPEPERKRRVRRSREPVALPPGREHGTSYAAARCSCDPCRAWNRTRTPSPPPTPEQRAQLTEDKRRAARASHEARRRNAAARKAACAARLARTGPITPTTTPTTTSPSPA